jgi:hypothetical protein
MFHTSQLLQKCSQCGLTDESHRDLYGTPLALLEFTFHPDQGPVLQGEVHLCRPCTHEVLSRRILHAAGITDEALSAETWQ